MSSTVKIIDKVGKKSNTYFNNINVYRTITVEETEMMASRETGCQLVVIESIKESEQEELKKFILEFTKNGNNTVLFYINDLSDEITSGVADELDYEIILTLEELHNKVEEITGVNVGNRYHSDKEKNDIEKIAEEFAVLNIDDSKESNKLEASEKYYDTDVESKVLTVSDVDTSKNEDTSREEIKRLNRIIEEQKETISIYSRNIEKHNEYENELSEKLRETKARLLELEEKVEEYEKIAKEKNAETEENSKETNEIIEDYKNKVEELSEKISELEEKYKEQKEEKERTVVELDNTKVELSETVRILSEAEEKLNETSIEIEQTNERFTELIRRVSELEDYKKQTISELEEKDSIIMGLNKDIEELKKNIESSDNEYRDKVRELDEYNKSLENNIKEANERIYKEESRNAVLSDSIEQIKKDSNEKLKEKDSIIDELHVGVENYKKQLEEKEVAEQIYDNTINEAEIDRLNNLVMEANSKREELYKENNELQNKCDELLKDKAELLQSFGKYQNGLTKTESVDNFTYSAQAKFIAVTGFGSCGVTLTALSIMQSIMRGKKAIYVDLDLTNPEFDQWAKTSPIIDGLNEIEELHRTGVGVFLEKGFESFKQCNKAIRKAKINGKEYEYINGIYSRIDDSNIANGEYEKLFNYLGNMYDYIVVDCGNVGESEIKNSMIRSIVGASTKKIYVTNGSSPVKVKVALNKAEEAGINELVREHGYTVINKCVNSGISGLVKNMIDGAYYIDLPIMLQLNGSTKTFVDERVTRDKFNSIISYIG